MLIVLFLSKITNNLKERTETSTEEGIQVSGEINARYLCVYVHTFFCGSATQRGSWPPHS